MRARTQFIRGTIRGNRCKHCSENSTVCWQYFSSCRQSALERDVKVLTMTGLVTILRRVPTLTLRHSRIILSHLLGATLGFFALGENGSEAFLPNCMTERRVKTLVVCSSVYTVMLHYQPSSLHLQALFLHCTHHERDISLTHTGSNIFTKLLQNTIQTPILGNRHSYTKHTVNLLQSAQGGRGGGGGGH